MLIVATVCAVLMTVALFRKKASAACVSALGAGTALLLWHNNHALTGTATWDTLLALTGVMLVLNCFKRTRRVIGLFAYILLTGFVLWQGLGSVGALILFSIAAIVVLLRARKSTVLSTAALIVVACLGLGVAAAPSFMGTAVAAEATTQDLTIKPGELLPDVAKCGTDDKFNQNSMPDTKDRVWGNSVSTPFKSTDKDAQFKELVSEICVNPVLGDAYIQALTDAQIGSFSVAQANPWMKEFTDKSQDGLKVWLTHKASDTKGFYVTDTSVGNYQYYAQMTNAVLYVLDNQGTKTATSKVNWPLGGLVTDTLPRAYKEAKPDKQESLPFMALTFTEKDEDCPYVLGVNLKDKRPETFDCKKAKEITPPTPTKRKPPVITPPHPSGTPTKPGHKPSSTPTPTPSHSTPTPCPPGYTGKPGHCLEIKDPTPIPDNTKNTPAASPSGSAKPPVHPSKTATPTKTSGGESTQTAEGSTPKPKPSETAPHAGDPTSTATACVPDPDSGKTC